MFLTPREVARFGQLVLQDGAWEGEQLVPPEWLDESLAATWDLGCRPERVKYGYLWWLYELGGYQIWTAGGYGGQNLHIVPDLDLVLVLTHVTKGDPADFEVVPSLDLLQRYVIPAVTDTAQSNKTSECVRRAHIVEVRSDGSARTILLDATSAIAPWSWSPDGTRIALHTNRDLNVEIYTMAADGSDFQRLTREFAPDTMPTWSPDGTTIVFTRGDPAHSDLYRMDAGGSNIVRLTNLEGYEHSPTWSPDGESIAFIGGDGSPSVFGESGALWMIGADGSDPLLLLDQPAGAPSWSPDGRSIAFESRGEGVSRIKVLDLKNGVVTDLGPGSLPRWSPDGAKLAFVSDRSGNLDVFVMEADGSNVQPLTTGPERDTLPSWSPDGETILYVSFEVEG
jgi:TolB protein